VEQTAPQTQPQPWWQFPKGRSGNPSGMTKARLRAAELFDEFRTVHSREPTASDAARLRAAGKLAAKLESTRGAVLDEDASRMTRNLNWTLARLGLGTAPVRAPTAAPTASGRGLLKERASE